MENSSLFKFTIAVWFVLFLLSKCVITVDVNINSEAQHEQSIDP